MALLMQINVTKALERQTGESPETLSRRRLEEVCSDLSNIYPFSRMQTSNGQDAELHVYSAGTTADARNASTLSQAQVEFIDFVLFHGIGELCRSLKQAHDWALYHSDIPLDTEEKNALFNLHILWCQLERLDEHA